MKKLVIINALCLLVTDGLHGITPYVFSRFKVFNQETGLSSNTLDVTESSVPNAIHIVIPDAPKPIFSLSKPGEEIGFTTQDMLFFLKNKTVKKTAILVLDWLDSMQKSDTDKLVGEVGAEIIALMNTLKKINPLLSYTLVGLGRGGVVATGIVTIENLPKQVTLITLGTPFAQDRTKHAAYTTLNAKNIDFAYIFHNNMPYRSSGLLPAANSTPAQAPENKTYYIRTIANNKEQLPHKISFLTLQDVLDACSHVNKQYKVHKHLWVSFSNVKTETHIVAGITKAAPKNAPLVQVLQDQAVSSKATKTYKKNWGSDTIVKKSDATPLRSGYKLTASTSSQKLAGKSA